MNNKHLSWYKEINNNFIIASRAYFLHQHDPKGFTWHFIETKAIKHDYYSSIIMWTHKNRSDEKMANEKEGE